MNKEKEFNGYNFDNKEARKQMKYVCVFNGDLDLNGCYAFKNKRELKKYLKECSDYRSPIAIFEVKDLTDKTI